MRRSGSDSLIVATDRIVRRHPLGGFSLIDVAKGPVTVDYKYRHVEVMDALRVAELLHPGEPVTVDPDCFTAQ